MKILNFLSVLGSRNSAPVSPSNARWRHRRRLVYIGFMLGVFMILFGLSTFWWDRGVSSEAIVSGTAIVTILLTAYVGGATYDDVKSFDSTNKELFIEDLE